jgi:DNA-binding MarR family transcriptional regulator
MAGQAKRRDVAALLAPLMRELIAAELPILDAHGLSMWGYAVLCALDESPVRTQAALAAAIGADKSRIIPVLDELADRDLIRRTPDPSDRRVRLLEITDAGRTAKDAAQAAIQRGEERRMQSLPTEDRRTFLRVLKQLASESAD